MYFWPNIVECFKEVRRVLKPGGTFLICSECSDPVRGAKWTNVISGMTVYDAKTLGEMLVEAGYREIRAHRGRGGRLCVTAEA